jgi:type IV pilus assembly protein PilO
MDTNFSQLSGIKQWGVVILGGALVTAALYFTMFKSQSESNITAAKALQKKVQENNELESYRPRLKEMDRQVANLKQQLDIERRIIPDDPQVDSFIEMMDSEAQKAGVWLRRYASKPGATKEYYSELPFDMELDGSYRSMLNFFDQVGHLDRIVNISGLLVSTTKKPTEAKTKHTYQYAPGESVVATFTASTYYSHDAAPAAAPIAPGAKK